MSDRPWLEDGDPALRVERALLKRLNAEQPPTGSSEQGWSTLAAAISGLQAPPIHPPPVIAPAVKAGVSLGFAAKIAVGVALTGAALWTGRAMLKSASTSSSSGQHQPLSGPTETPATVEPEGATGKTEEGRAGKIAQPARPASSSTTLAEEGRLLAKAHQLVQSGQAQQALDVLRLSETRYPHSVLYPEREVLTIEALGATGASSAARQRADRFLKRYPNSAYADRLKRFVE
jgi:hypothetical protein